MAMFSSPWALLSEMQRQKIQEQALLDRVKLWVEQGEDEIRMANEYLDERPDEMKSRLLRAVDYIEQEIDVGPQRLRQSGCFHWFRRNPMKNLCSCSRFASCRRLPSVRG